MAQGLDRKFANLDSGMAAGGAYQDRNGLVLRPPPNCDDSLFLKFKLWTGIKRADQNAEALLARHAAEIRNRAFAQLDIPFILGNPNQIGRCGVAIIVAGNAVQGAPLQVVSTLIPKMKSPLTGYVTRPSERDFFYLSRKR